MVACLVACTFSFAAKAQENLNEGQLKALKTDDIALFKEHFSPEQYNHCFTIKDGLYSPLLASIKMDKKNIFNFLMQQKLDLDKICDDKSPLMYAAKYGKLAFAKDLIAHGAKIDLVSPENKTASDYAKNYNQMDIYDLLANGKVSLSSDGPIVVYENGKPIQYQIVPKDNSFSLVRKAVDKQQLLTCHVDETKDSFTFPLRKHFKAPADEYAMPSKLLVLSDIEGNFKGFKSILIGNKVIDEQLRWRFGKNHLVLLGDFFDRGTNVTECLWLIYKLEEEAEKQGGKVHFILGNHELMNLKGQLKYVRAKYTAHADTLQLDYSKWYNRDSELGRWLRTKNSVEKIGDLLFVHAGIRKDFPREYTIQQINENIRTGIDKTPEGKSSKEDIFLGNDGPLWYRAIAAEKERQEEVEATLAQFKAEKMIIGHTVMKEIKYLYNGKVIAIDLDHQKNSDEGRMFALWIEDGRFYMVDHRANRRPLQLK